MFGLFVFAVRLLLPVPAFACASDQVKPRRGMFGLFAALSLAAGRRALRALQASPAPKT